jgi:hypothetical protein
MLSDTELRGVRGALVVVNEEKSVVVEKVVSNGLQRKLL